MTPKYYPWLNPGHFLRYFFTSLPLLKQNEKEMTKSSKKKKKYIPYFLTQSSLSPHVPVVVKIIDVERFVSSVESVILK